MKIIIASPRGLAGGIIVLHMLCKLLSEQGHDVKIFYFGEVDKDTYQRKVIFWYRQCKWIVKDTLKLMFSKVVVNKEKLSPRYEKYWYTPVSGCKRKIFPFFNKKNTVVIYPEIVYGNFLRATKVVRWLLYHNRYQGDKNAFGKDDLIVCYREIFNDKELNPDNKILHVNYFDLNLYKQTNFGERVGNCYILRKGKNRSDLPNSFDGIIVDDLTEQQKVKVFNQCKYCYSYDMQTAYSDIAALCGCISIKVPESGCSATDYMKGNDSRYGIAYGDSADEIEYAIKTRQLLVDRFYDKSRDESNKNEVESFIKILEKEFY